MVNIKLRTGLGLIAVLVLAAACGGPPYIHDTSEFNRGSEFFSKPRTTRNNVTVCYRKGATTAAAVQRLAAAECGRFGKSAALLEQNLNVCPLLTPIAAVFECQGPGAPQRAGS